jgi:hypothetical protein
VHGKHAHFSLGPGQNDAVDIVAVSDSLRSYDFEFQGSHNFAEAVDA